MVDKEKILELYVEPEVTIEYFFIEKAEKQIKPINDDQGYLYGFLNLFFTGKYRNDNLTAFKDIILDELNYCLKEYDYFKSDQINLLDYKFALVDNYKNMKEYNTMDEIFFKALIESLRNLIIVGKNFDLEKFKHHQIFNEWFDKYSNRN